MREGTIEAAVEEIGRELNARCAELEAEGKLLESHRLRQRTQYDMEMLREMGFCNGIENYSRILDGRNPGDRPVLPASTTSPTTSSASSTSPTRPCPQIGGMYEGDRSRKQTLVDYGFRLPSALDNRPQTFDEFLSITPQIVFVSRDAGRVRARALDERSSSRSCARRASSTRRRGARDAQPDRRPHERGAACASTSNERVLVTTLTKKMSEDLTDYLLEMGFKVRYLHSEVDTLERIQIIRDLRLGEYDVLVGVNLLREGLDLPEVSLVAILDADKEGFLRGETSLIQTIGRAARNVEGTVLMYADKETAAMRAAIERDRPPPRDPARLQRGARHHGRDDRQGHQRHRRVPAGRGQDAEGPPALRAQAGQDARTMSHERARADDRRARGGDARRGRRPALRVRRAPARRDPRAAPRADGDAGVRGAGVVAGAASAQREVPAHALLVMARDPADQHVVTRAQVRDDDDALVLAGLQRRRALPAVVG